MAKKINVSSLLKSAMNDDINPGETLKSLNGYSDDADPRSGHVDPPVDFGLKKI
jgi:hypothetical protein